MSESGEEGKKSPNLSVENEPVGSSGKHRRRHHRHHRDRDHNNHDDGNRVVQRQQRGGCYSSAHDEEKRSKLFAELVAERETVDADRNPHLYRLIQTEISRVAISPEAEHSQEVDLYNDYPITLNVRCFPPVKLQPNFNYAGRIIGPKGAYLKALMRETRSKIVVLGQGVMKDKDKEAELLRSGDPKYMHLTEEMHFSVTVEGPAVEAYDRMSNAIDCLKRQILSDSRDLMSLPWIFRVVENGAAPPKGMRMPRRSVGRDSGFRQRDTSPPSPPKRRHIVARRDSERRSSHTRYLEPARPRYIKERSSPAARPARNYARSDYEESPRAERTAGQSYRRTAPAPTSPDSYRERDSIKRNSSGQRNNRARARRSRSPSPGYAAAEASSSYYKEDNSHDREAWLDEDESRIRAQNNSRRSQS